jgi:hypothetical protein
MVDFNKNPPQIGIPIPSPGITTLDPGIELIIRMPGIPGLTPLGTAYHDHDHEPWIPNTQCCFYSISWRLRIEEKERWRENWSLKVSSVSYTQFQFRTFLFTKTFGDVEIGKGTDVSPPFHRLLRQSTWKHAAYSSQSRSETPST